MKPYTLKPCPMCGGVVTLHIQPAAYFMFGVRVQCKGCALQTGICAYGNSGILKAEECSHAGQEVAIEQAVHRWNRRAQKGGAFA